MSDPSSDTPSESVSEPVLGDERVAPQGTTSPRLAVAAGFVLGLLVGGLAMFFIGKPNDSVPATDQVTTASADEYSISVEYTPPAFEPSRYLGDIVTSVEITDSSCQLDGSADRPEFSGRLKNTAGKAASYIINMRFTYDDGELIDEVNRVMDWLDPDQVQQFDVDATGISSDDFDPSRGFNCSEPVVTSISQ